MLSYDVYSLTSKTEDDYCGAMVTWVNKASFESPMIFICIKRASLLYQVVNKKGEFLLHLLRDYQPPPPWQLHFLHPPISKEDVSTIMNLS